jgi:hypothetical protein
VALVEVDQEVIIVVTVQPAVLMALLIQEVEQEAMNEGILDLVQLEEVV